MNNTTLVIVFLSSLTTILYPAMESKNTASAPLSIQAENIIDIDQLIFNKPLEDLLKNEKHFSSPFTVESAKPGHSGAEKKDTIAYTYSISKKSPVQRFYKLSGTTLKVKASDLLFYADKKKSFKGISIFFDTDYSKLDFAVMVNQIKEKYKAFGGELKNPDPKYYAKGIRYFVWKVKGKLITMSYYPPKAEVTPNTVFLSIIDESFKLKTYPMYITGTGIDGYFKN